MKHIVEKGWNQMIFKEVFCENDDGKATHEIVPDEDLWEDGELSTAYVMHKMRVKVLQEGSWVLIRRVSDDNEHRNS